MDPLEFHLQMAVSCMTWVLETKPKSPGRAIPALKCWPTSPASLPFLGVSCTQAEVNDLQLLILLSLPVPCIMYAVLEPRDPVYQVTPPMEPDQHILGIIPSSPKPDCLRLQLSSKGTACSPWSTVHHATLSRAISGLNAPGSHMGLDAHALHKYSFFSFLTGTH